MMFLGVRHPQSFLLTVCILGCVINRGINFQDLVAWLLMSSGKGVGEVSVRWALT